MVSVQFYRYLQLLRALFEGIRYREDNERRKEGGWREVAVWNMSAA